MKSKHVKVVLLETQTGLAPTVNAMRIFQSSPCKLNRYNSIESRTLLCANPQSTNPAVLPPHVIVYSPAAILV